MESPALELARRACREGDPSDGLAAVVELRRELEALEVTQVRHALDEGWPWRRIAEALGVSKQAAHKKHGVRRTAQGEPVAEERRRLVITGQARGVVEYGREEAVRSGDGAVEPQHLLLGIIRSGDGPAASALRNAGLDLERARREIRGQRVKESDTDEHALPRARLPVSPEARASFEQSLREAVARGDSHLGVEHVLLALLGVPDGGAVQALVRLGVPVGRLHHSLERALAAAARPSPADASAGTA